ncbi:MAG: PaaI family thioesterase [Paracoccaceae bacterium]
MTTGAPAGPGLQTGLLAMEEMARLSGVEFFRGCMEGRLPYPPVASALAMRMVELDAGRVVWESAPPGWFLNPAGTVHGGYAMTVLDSALACAVHSALPAGRGVTTLEAKVNLTRAIPAGSGPYRAEGIALSLGRRTATAEAKLRDAQGRLMAFATTTCLLFDL